MLFVDCTSISVNSLDYMKKLPQTKQMSWRIQAQKAGDESRQYPHLE